MTFLQCSEELGIFPRKLPRLATFDWEVGSKEINEVCLVRQVDTA